MKVLIAHNRYSSAQPSGENIIVDAEIGQLRQAGVEVVDFQRDSDDIASFTPAGKLALVGKPIYARGAQRELAETIRAEKPDLMHLHNSYPLLSPAVVRTAHASGIPVVQTIHNYRHDCMNGLYFRDGALCYDCHGKRWNIPGLVHGCYRGSRAQSAVMATSLGAHRDTWRSVDRFIALTDGIASYLRSIGMSDEQIRVKPNAIPDPGTPPKLGSGFLFAARLVPEKGIATLLSAWRRLEPGSNGILRIAGDGPLRSEVERAAADRSDVEYLGALDRDGMQKAMAASSIMTVPSEWEDVLPTTCLEALATGRAILATTLGGAPFIAGVDTERPAGIAVRPEAEELLAALRTMWRDQASFAANARDRYERVFSPTVVFEQLLDIYRDVIEGYQRRG
ncbi:glycosyltransferase family 4 protein [Natronoglycomyces albus]|uniref:Glycosyltransferase family 4 protein n=1 Tax=Natronoglycomyces albus TaxID=2811108 RepID=A0A895XRY2_9ACTN|nr:glycosyltransferase family 4 protein [Natronoglycomyces albus]QSB05020.1 glycosyltransferase family 4 protein [Natronoglycomyces albus]